jgi:hypothetical protein
MMEAENHVSAVDPIRRPRLTCRIEQDVLALDGRHATFPCSIVISQLPMQLLEHLNR